MRAIHVVQLDKSRTAVLLTRETVLGVLSSVTVAPITTRVRGLSVEVNVGPENGLDGPGVINCDNIVTVGSSNIGRRIGSLLPSQEPMLTEAILAAFDLE